MFYHTHQSSHKPFCIPRRVAPRLMNDRLHTFRCGEFGVSVSNDVVIVLTDGHCGCLVVG